MSVSSSRSNQPSKLFANAVAAVWNMLINDENKLFLLLQASWVCGNVFIVVAFTSNRYWQWPRRAKCLLHILLHLPGQTLPRPPFPPSSLLRWDQGRTQSPSSITCFGRYLKEGMYHWIEPDRSFNVSHFHIIYIEKDKWQNNSFSQSGWILALSTPFSKLLLAIG